jgi:hypothetical protein
MRSLHLDKPEAIESAIRRAHTLLAERGERITAYGLFSCAEELLEEDDASPRAFVALVDAVDEYWRQHAR